MLIIWLLFLHSVYPDFPFLLNSFWIEIFYKTFITLVYWWWCSLIIVVCLRKNFILFLICIFLGCGIVSQFYFSQHSKMWCQCPLANIVSYAKFAVIPIFCSAVSVFPSGYISLVDCFKQWIMMCLFIVVILLVLELLELLCLWV